MWDLQVQEQYRWEHLFSPTQSGLAEGVGSSVLITFVWTSQSSAESIRDEMNRPDDGCSGSHANHFRGLPFIIYANH